MAKHSKRCAVCGREFYAPPSSKKITCSSECSATQKRRSHLGKSNIWSAPARERSKEQGQTENLKKGTQAALLSPKSGPYETNLEAKHWALKSPDGIIYEFDNLKKFVRDHPEFFSNPNSAVSALYAAAGCTVGTPSPSRKNRQFGQYKGWQVISRGPSNRERGEIGEKKGENTL